MKLKKLFAAVCATAMVASLAGCSTSSSTAADTTAAEKKDVVKVIDIDLTEEQYAFGVDKDDADLLKSVNDFIKKIKDDGTFEDICNHYFGDGTPVAVTSAKLDDSKDQLVVATNAAFEPFEYMDGDSYYGIDMEIAQKLAEYLNKELVINNMDFDSVCLSVGQHKCDIAMAGLTVKEERKEYVTFSETYYNAAQKLIVKTDDTAFDACKTAEDVENILKGFKSDVKIGVQQGTTGQFYCEGDEEWEFDGFEVTTTPYKNGSLAVQAMINNNINYVIIDSAPAACITKAINALQ